MRGHGAPLDPGRRSRRAALDPAPDAGAVRIDRAVLSRGLSTTRTRTSAPRSTVSRPVRSRSTSGAPTDGVPRRPGVCYFFPRPSAGSACKRLNLFLRWMVRRDEVDLGAWTRVPASKLIVPLDTHVIRLGRCLRLTRYVSPGWRMAADITAIAARARSGRSGPLRFFALPRRHDERLRFRQEAGRLAMSAERPVPAARARATPLRAASRRRARRRCRDRLRSPACASAPCTSCCSPAPTEAQRVAFVREEPCADRTCQTLWIGNAARRRGAGRLARRRAPNTATRSPGRRTAAASAFVINGYQLRIFDGVHAKAGAAAST